MTKITRALRLAGRMLPEIAMLTGAASLFLGIFADGDAQIMLALNGYGTWLIGATLRRDRSK